MSRHAFPINNPARSRSAGRPEPAPSGARRTGKIIKTRRSPHRQSLRFEGIDRIDSRKVVADVGDHPYAVDAAERATEILTLQLPAHDVRRGAYLDEPSAHQIAHCGLSRQTRLPTSQEPPAHSCA